MGEEGNDLQVHLEVGETEVDDVLDEGQEEEVGG